MNCPKCDKQMEEVKTSCKYGIPIVLDQCPECGGVWFDNDELYRAKHGAASALVKYHEEKNAQGAKGKQEYFALFYLCNT